ncbi:protein kinase [Myxococcaceae bacterium GXIMD 01537]
MRCPSCHRRVAGPCPAHPSAPRPSVPAPEAAPEVPGFQGLTPLGHGGFARVYAARREKDSREVALKVLHPLAVERLGREREALRRIGPPVTPEWLGEATTAGGETVLVMERIEGSTLAAWLAARPGSGAVDWAEARGLMLALTEAVARVHAAGFVHRDLKPENVMRAPGRVIVLDFGLARPVGEAVEPLSLSLTRTGQRMGTADYMAPEQCLDARDVGPAADLYSLGVLCFELLSGRPPFVGEPAAVQQAHVSRRPPSLVGLAPVGPEVEALVRRLLAKEPHARFESARALHDALLRVPEEAPVPLEPRHAPAPVAGPRELALLGVRTSLDLPTVLSLLAPWGGEPARVEAGLALIAFPHAGSVEAGVGTALKAAEALTTALPSGSQRAVHCAPLRVRERGSRVTLGGSALERPERWWPEDAAPLLVTPEAHGRLTSSESAANLTPLPEPPPLTATVGRASELEWLRAGLARVRETRAPALLTVLGDEGLGKTRLLEEWRRELADVPDLRMLHVEAAPEESSSSETGLRHLLAAVLEVPPGMALDEALRQRLPAALPTTTAAEHPGARRQAIARALASRLRSLAAERPLVLLVDEAHALDPTALDVLERATLSEVDAPLCVVLAGEARLRTLRPYLGERAAHAAHLTLEPLPEPAARELLCQLLRPVEVVPEGVLREWVTRCGGVPLRMVETVRALRAAGAIRIQPGAEGAYLAADALPGPSSDRPEERIAERRLASLAPGLRSLLQVAALLGDEVRREEVSATLAHLDPEVALDLSQDPGVGLERLARAGLVEPRSQGLYRFPHPSLREAFASLLAPADRRRICVAALQALPETPTSRRARLAEGAGEIPQAITLRRALADGARRAHRILEAERHYSALLALLPREEDAARREALAGRGRVRYRLQRFDDALEDLRAARSLAEAHGDAALEVDLLFEEATVLDWQEDMDGATRLMAQALQKLGADAPAGLKARAELARGRVLFRQGDGRAAAVQLERAAEAGHAAGDAETEAIARSMLGAILAWEDRVDDAARCYDAALALCETTGDTLHLGVTLNNRVVLHIKHRDLASARADLKRAVALGREVGNVQIERCSAFNLAEFLHYQGRASEALPLARRAHVLGQRFFPRSVTLDALLLARLACALGDTAEAAAQGAWVDARRATQPLPPAGEVLLGVVRRVVDEAREPLAHDDAAWASLLAASRESCTADERLEVLLWAARSARRVGQQQALNCYLAEAREVVRTAPLWTERLQAFMGGNTDPL